MRFPVILLLICGTALGVRMDVNRFVSYEIFSSVNRHDPVIFKGDPDGSIDFKWNFDQKTIFFIHGSFLDDTFTSTLLNAFLDPNDDQKNVTLIGVNWQKGTRMNSNLDYNIAAVGEHLAKVIKILVDNSWINSLNIEMIGHGMGSYIAGLAGRELDSYANIAIQKIIALDPAMITFDGGAIDFEHILRETDAKHVEVIHSNDHLRGFGTPLGHVDIYLNGGSQQPGCPIMKEDFEGCSHGYAFIFFAYSLRNRIIGYYCESLDDLEHGQCEQNELFRREMFGRNPAQLPGEECKNFQCLYSVNTTYAPNIPQAHINWNERKL